MEWSAEGPFRPGVGMGGTSADVTVEFSGQKKTAVTDAAGKWLVRLEPMPASSKPQTLTVSSSVEKGKLQVGNVLVGEVWLCSGQSNMGMSMKTVTAVEEEKKRADRPALRIFRIGLNSSLEPQKDCPGDWVICSPNTLEQFSAAAYFFGAEIHKELGVPVGLILSAWGGTHIETWCPAEPLKKFPHILAYMARQDAKAANFDEEGAKKEYEKSIAKWKTLAAQAKKAGKSVPSKPKEPDYPRSWKYYPGKLYNGMIHPLVPYGLRGFLWYQGEGNAHTVHDAIIYREELGILVTQLRSLWGYEFPAYAVQLPNYRAGATESDAWAYIRESILNFRRDIPNAGVAIAIDVGEANDIHPKNKQPVGYRLARQGLVYTYGKNLVPGGPIYRSMKKDGENIIIEFDDIGSGLTVRGNDSLKTFTIAGEDRNFVPAKAVIENDKVIVSSPLVKKPVAVRYAWANNPQGCNLFNKEGFPASPFRTDTWEPKEKPASWLDRY